MTCCGNGAARESETERTHVVDNLVCNRFDFFEALALFCRRACAFVYENGACNASATDGIERVFDCDVVVDVHCVNLDAVLLSVAHCVVEVHAVARIVFDDEKHAFVGCALLDCVVNLNLRGGCENVAANRSVKHAFSDKTCVCGFVTATAAGDKADFCFVDVFLFDDFVFFDKFKFGVSRCKTVAHIVHETLSGVHNFLHNILLVIRKTSRQTRFRADFYKTLPW